MGYVLVTSTSSATNGEDLLQGKYVSNTSYRDEWIPIRMLPTSGYELEYDESVWAGTPSNHNNCYAYVLNNQVKPGTTQIWHKQQPGEFYNNNNGLNEDIPQGYSWPTDIIISGVTYDFSKYNELYQTDLIFQRIDKYAVCPYGTYKVALVVSSGDYHWYRQDADGLWSHKQGLYPISRKDASGNYIIDPDIADRGSYTSAPIYFAVEPWNNLYTSALNLNIPVEDEAYTISASHAATVSLELWKTIQIGMTLDEVTSILGQDGQDIGSGTIIHMYPLENGQTGYVTYGCNSESYFVTSLETEGGLT